MASVVVVGGVIGVDVVVGCGVIGVVIGACGGGVLLIYLCCCIVI